MSQQPMIAVELEDLAVDPPERWRAERRRAVVIGLAETIAALQLEVAQLEEHNETLKAGLVKAHTLIAERLGEQAADEIDVSD